MTRTTGADQEGAVPDVGARSRPTGRIGLTSLGQVSQALGARLPRLDDTDRDAMFDELLPDGDAFRRYVERFVWLIVLSAAIAGFGLLADSAAVVIGAMLVAPLMTPILATAAAICVSDNRRLLRALLVLAGGTVAAIVVGFLVSKVSGNTIVSADDLPSEVLARTEPGLIDLAIAVAAGAAAGYVAPRRDAVSALPGVGIAVALVPPLATVGITLEAGAGRLAGGALLLYLTNLAAIVFAGALVLLIGGLRPADATAGRRVRVGLLITVGAVLAVAVPLTIHTFEVIRDTRFEREVVSAVREWDDTVKVVELTTDVDRGRGDVELRIASPGQSRPAWELADLIADRHAGGIDLVLFIETAERVEVSTR